MEDTSINANYIMVKEPEPDLTIEKAEEKLTHIVTERELAELFASVNNKAWWLEDDIYDFEQGSEEYKKAVEISDMWFYLYEKIKDKIFDILKTEGICIPEKGQIEVLKPFMKRNGFEDGAGWWIKA